MHCDDCFRVFSPCSKIAGVSGIHFPSQIAKRGSETLRRKLAISPEVDHSAPAVVARLCTAPPATGRAPDATPAFYLHSQCELAHDPFFERKGIPFRNPFSTRGNRLITRRMTDRAGFEQRRAALEPDEVGAGLSPRHIASCLVCVACTHLGRSRCGREPPRRRWGHAAELTMGGLTPVSTAMSCVVRR